jgi:lipid II:glycine glycyltransferase (peptidoglycan interpeptide bridge formation enzyme)
MYTVMIDQWSSEEWDNACATFSGRSLYQMGLYGLLHSSGLFRYCSRIAVFKDQQIAAAAQLRIKRIPVLSVGLADVDWGPIWNDREGNADFDALGAILNALRSEYCGNRKLQVRIRPRSTMDKNKDAMMAELFEKHGFRRNPTDRPYHTVIIDLDKSLDMIRAEFHQKWRNQLNVAERAGLVYEYGNSLEHFDRFYSIYKAMWRHKKFPTGVRLPIVREMQRQLPQNEKLLVTIVREDDRDIGATVCVAAGDTMLYYLGATAPNLRSDSRPGYLLQWLHIQKAKELGLRWYDLGGYDDNYQTIARFKKRTNGLQLIFPGQFETLPGKSPSKVLDLCEKAFHSSRRLITGR